MWYFWVLIGSCDSMGILWTRLHVLEFPALFSFLSRQHWLGDDGMCQQDGIQTRVTINIICRCVSWKIFESLLKSYARTQNGAAIKDQAARPRSVFSIATAFIKQSTSKVVRLAARGSWKLCGTSGLVPLNEYIYIHVFFTVWIYVYINWYIYIEVYTYYMYMFNILACYLRRKNSAPPGASRCPGLVLRRGKRLWHEPGMHWKGHFLVLNHDECPFFGDVYLSI